MGFVRLAENQRNRIAFLIQPNASMPIISAMIIRLNLRSKNICQVRQSGTYDTFSAYRLTTSKPRLLLITQSVEPET